MVEPQGPDGVLFVLCAWYEWMRGRPARLAAAESTARARGAGRAAHKSCLLSLSESRQFGGNLRESVDKFNVNATFLLL
jgi:hypothetical protein